MPGQGWELTACNGKQPLTAFGSSEPFGRDSFAIDFMVQPDFKGLWGSFSRDFSSKMPHTARTPLCFLFKGSSWLRTQVVSYVIHFVSPWAPSPASALCTSGHPASSLMYLLISWLQAYDNFSLLLLSWPHCPVSRQNTHNVLLSSFLRNQPPLDILKEGFSELVSLIFGFWKILLRLGFTSWIDRFPFLSASLGCWLSHPLHLSDQL